MSIRKFRVTVKMFIKQYLPGFLRTAERLKSYCILLYPFEVLNDEWVTYRDQSVTRANVSFETGSLEWYLNELYDPTERRIYIETNDDDGLEFGLSDTEPDDFQEIGLSGSEPDDFVEIPLKGEHPDFGFKSFGVYVPTDIIAQAEAIKSVVNNYRWAGKTFTTVEYTP